MSKTFMEKDLDEELEGVEDSDEDMEKDNVGICTVVQFYSSTRICTV